MINDYRESGKSMHISRIVYTGALAIIATLDVATAAATTTIAVASAAATITTIAVATAAATTTIAVATAAATITTIAVATAASGPEKGAAKSSTVAHQSK